MKIMFSAGEASGDMHAAAVAAELKKNHPDVQLEDLIQLDDTLEQKAKEAMLKRLQVQ